MGGASYAHETQSATLMGCPPIGLWGVHLFWANLEQER